MKLALLIFLNICLNLLVLYPACAVYDSNASELSRLINEGITYHSNRNYLLAIKSFNSALGLDPNNREILENLSIAHNNYGKYLAERTDGTGAIREFRHALYYNSDNQIARSNLEFKLKSSGTAVGDHTERIKQAGLERRQGNNLAAIAELNEANKITASPDAYCEIGENYHVLYLKSFDKAEYANKAISAFTKASDLDKNNIRPLIGLGDVYIAKNELSRGIDFYESAIKKDPANEAAQSALINGWLSTIRVAPHIANNHVGLGTAYQLKGDLTQAEKSFRRALQLDPNNQFASKGLQSLEEDRIKIQTNLFMDRAVVLQKEKNLDASLSNYVKALNLQPANADIHYNIGTVFQAKEDFERAKKAYNRAIELRNGDHPEAKLALASLSKQEQEKNVEEAFDQAVNLQNQGKHQESIDIYSKISKDRPNDDVLFFNLGTAYNALGKLELALLNYEKANSIKANPEYEKTIKGTKVEIANHLLEEGIKSQTGGNLQKSVENYKRVVELVNDNPSAWYNLGTAYQGLDQKTKALEAYKKAYELDPVGQSDAIFFAALILEEQKKLLEAINLYQKYIKVDPSGTYAKESKGREKYIKSFL